MRSKTCACNEAGALELLASLDKSAHWTVTFTSLTAFSDKFASVDAPPLSIVANNVTEIKDGAFQNMTSLVSISCPACTKVGPRAFMNCTSLVRVDMLNVRAVDDRAFCTCTKLNVVNMQNAVRVARAAFHDCAAITAVACWMGAIANILRYADGPVKVTTNRAVAVNDWTFEALFHSRAVPSADALLPPKGLKHGFLPKPNVYTYTRISDDQS